MFSRWSWQWWVWWGGYNSTKCWNPLLLSATLTQMLASTNTRMEEQDNSKQELNWNLSRPRPRCDEGQEFYQGEGFLSWSFWATKQEQEPIKFLIYQINLASVPSIPIFPMSVTYHDRIIHIDLLNGFRYVPNSFPGWFDIFNMTIILHCAVHMCPISFLQSSIQLESWFWL